MSDLVRLSISIEEPLLKRLDRMVSDSQYSNRSEFVRDMVRDMLVRREWDRDEVVVGTMTLLYDHHTRGLNGRLTEIQHSHHAEILASTHVHLDEALCAEMILMRGPAGRLKVVADRLRQLKGVIHAAISLGSTGRALL